MSQIKATQIQLNTANMEANVSTGALQQKPGTDASNASELSAGPFTGLLSTDGTVQEALSTLDNHTHIAADITDLSSFAIPAGAIIIWTGAACPAGWTRDTTFDGVYIKGASTPNLTPSGSNTHTHTVASHTHSIGSHTHTFTTSDPDDGINIVFGGGSAASMQHTHTGTTNASTGNTGSSSPATDSQSNEPSHISVLFCKKD